MYLGVILYTFCVYMGCTYFIYINKIFILLKNLKYLPTGGKSELLLKEEIMSKKHFFMSE